MKRRDVIKISLLSSVFGISSCKVAQSSESKQQQKIENEQSDRQYWVSLLAQIATPILANVSKGEFKKNMPMVVSPIFDKRNPDVGYLEAFGRLVAGMAPWLALPDDNTEEGKLRQSFKKQILSGITHGANPSSPDYFVWYTKSTSQPMVDAAHLAQAFLRAPKALWEPLPEETKQNIIKEFKALRNVRLNESNWLLFGAMTEAFLYAIGEEFVQQRIDYAVYKFDKEWYVGDGWYSDGPKFSFDHYNGYVIHCMQVESLRAVLALDSKYKELYDRAYKRMQRYAHHLERIISPEGYPLVVGRSSTYRNAAFQPLAAVALDDKLPQDITKGQVRGALTAVLKNTFVKSSFDKYGWLTMGVVGDKQTNLADYYTNVGSMYVASLSFLPLGLPAEDEFWTVQTTEWTSQKIWKGEPFPKDYYVTY